MPTISTEASDNLRAPAPLFLAASSAVRNVPPSSVEDFVPVFPDDFVPFAADVGFDLGRCAFVADGELLEDWG